MLWPFGLSERRHALGQAPDLLRRWIDAVTVRGVDHLVNRRRSHPVDTRLGLVLRATCSRDLRLSIGFDLRVRATSREQQQDKPDQRDKRKDGDDAHRRFTARAVSATA